MYMPSTLVPYNVPPAIETVKYPGSRLSSDGADQPAGMSTFNVPYPGEPAHVVGPAVYMILKVFPLEAAVTDAGFISADPSPYGVLVGVAVGVTVCVTVWVTVSVTVCVTVSVIVCVTVSVTVGVTVDVSVTVGVSLDVSVTVGVTVCVTVSVTVLVTVGVKLAVFVSVTVDVGVGAITLMEGELAISWVTLPLSTDSNVNTAVPAVA
jgi:hypothetical protein